MSFMKPDEITLVFNKDTLKEYEVFYFSEHPKAKKKPIPHPYHESINTWMVMKRPQMNALKQRWKAFIQWLVEKNGYSNIGISQCTLEQIIYYPTEARRDIDNYVPKFILDGLTESGMVVDDSSRHITKLSLSCDIDKNNPRTELIFNISAYAEMN